jgi:hypothetical protein
MDGRLQGQLERIEELKASLAAARQQAVLIPLLRLY